MELTSTQLFFKDIAQYKVLTKEQEEELFVKAKKGDRNAYNVLINSNLKLVVSIAKKFKERARNLELLDLIQEGSLGLMVAYDKFDIAKGFKFSTYATFWIKQSIENAISNKNEMIRKPVYLKQNIIKMKKAQAKLEQDGHTATAEEIAKELKTSVKSVELMQRTLETTQTISMDKTLNNDTDDTILDFIADESATPDEVANQNGTAKKIDEIMKKVLTARECEVVRYRYGFITGEEETLQTIGDKLGITRERARQIEANAMKKLRTNKTFQQLAQDME